MKQSRMISWSFLGLAAVASFACSDGGSGPNPEPEFEVAVASCQPTEADSTSETIGSSGGSINIGRNRLVVPAGALSSPVSISMRILADSSSSVILQPEGLAFAVGKPALLRLTYEQCTPPASALSRLLHPDPDDDDHDHFPPPATIGVAYTTDDLRILELLPSVADSSDQEITAELSHFSRYAVAW